MFLINKCYDDGSGHSMYNASSIIGIYDNYQLAFDNLIKKLDQLKYTYNKDNSIFIKNYFFTKMETKNGKEVTNGISFEIIEKKYNINEIKIK